jgi:hypothetical protein
MANFALAHELAHRPDGVLNRYRRIDAVDVVQIDDINFEPLQTELAARLNEFRPPGRGRRPVGRAQIAELAGDHVVVAMALHRAGDQFLVAALSVGIRAVEKIDADLARMAQGIDRRISVRLVIERCHRRAAETDRRDLEPTEHAPSHSFNFLFRVKYPPSWLGEWFCVVGMVRGIATNQRISYPTIILDRVA